MNKKTKTRKSPEPSFKTNLAFAIKSGDWCGMINFRGEIVASFSFDESKIGVRGYAPGTRHVSAIPLGNR